VSRALDACLHDLPSLCRDPQQRRWVTPILRAPSADTHPATAPHQLPKRHQTQRALHALYETRRASMRPLVSLGAQELHHILWHGDRTASPEPGQDTLMGGLGEPKILELPTKELGWQQSLPDR
jgi:hypothetical protein